MSTRIDLSIDNGFLVASDAASGAVLWRTKPFGAPVVDAEFIPSTGNTIALLDGMFRPDRLFENLLCLTREGDIRWVAQMPPAEGVDDYVSFSLDGDVLHANTWSCYWVELDLTSGKILSQTFVK